MIPFRLVSKFAPCGDQPAAIDKLVEGIENGFRTQVLLGVTGSGKTFTMANVIERVQRPALVIAHNKTLAAQLCNEFREFFPENRVEFFVSYYDYYQPEAYIPRSDTYIEKELEINDEIDKLRHSATASLCERRDTVVVASVSCIYGLGAPEDYYRQAVSVREGDETGLDDLLRRLVDIQYKRADFDFVRSTFRVRGDVVDVFPAGSSETALRIEFFGDTVERIREIDAVTATPVHELKHAMIFPATHYVIGGDREEIFRRILADKEERVRYFEERGKLIEAQRINERVNYDVEMMREVGYCSGIENYSRYFDGRSPGQPPYTLLDFFPKDFVTFIDESHMTLPQLRAMYNGDLARKKNLVDYGFRLPAAYDNRPLNFAEFDARIKQFVCVSATPARYELELADDVAEQLIRPTGLLDPVIEVKPVKGQVEDLLGEISRVTAEGGRVLVTTLTKKMAESLTDYLRESGVRVRYMHSDIDTLERIEIVGGLRGGDFDVLVGINLLREGLDLPEVRLVAILDADKEGFLRSETALIQTVGRAARNAEGRVVMYADTVTDSMRRAIDETARRRRVQDEYNKAHGIVPRTVEREFKNTLEITKKKVDRDKMSPKNLVQEAERVKGLMQAAAGRLDFEAAIKLRDELNEIRKLIKKLR
ncbi:MAG TPA: excinuclease ABC subunit UvrB [Candidatus Limadaptatus stercoripullorum]|uniref:UvrABC system protein B n=1 Tax=Candidatus Limadaptatus stercoripullorum TaxID=2840846 RepID=A0A9D1SWM6_9FIRM|nr:excinuclease ABC subunit UvrB [Candidatus Limadaptatus stercoripullorum]